MRNCHLMVRVTAGERAQINALARQEKMQTSSYIRRKLLLEAEQRGIVPLPETRNRDAVDSEAQRVAAAAK